MSIMNSILRKRRGRGRTFRDKVLTKTKGEKSNKTSTFDSARNIGE